MTLMKSMISFDLSSSSFKKLILPHHMRIKLQSKQQKTKKKLKEGSNMLGYKGPTSSPNVLMFQSHSPKGTTSLSIIHTMMSWSYVVSSNAEIS
jgi:hypothetical protein